MTAAEIEEARRAIKRLAMPEDERRTRRFAPAAAALGSTRAAASAARSQPGGAIDLEFRSPHRPRRLPSSRSATFPAR